MNHILQQASFQPGNAWSQKEYRQLDPALKAQSDRIDQEIESNKSAKGEISQLQETLEKETDVTKNQIKLLIASQILLRSQILELKNSADQLEKQLKHYEENSL